MITKNFSKRGRVLLLSALCLLAGSSALASPPSCEPELTGVFLMGGIYPGTALSLDVMHISEVGPATYPTEAELLEIVTEVYVDDYFYPYYYHQPVALVGNFQLFLAQPMDFGTVTIVDIRDGSVVFASGMVWMGFGETVHPESSSHEWVWEAGPLAPEPAGVSIIPSLGWDDDYWGSQEDLTQISLDYIRQTDVMHSFGTCAPYQVTSFLHTPTVGATDPNVAVEVLIISGYAGPPWGPDPIDTTPTSWDMVKAVYR